MKTWIKKSKKKTPKSEASDAMSRYIRLRDALAYCKEHGIDLGQFNRLEDIPVKCCDCDAVNSWIKFDAGHYIGRGSGGSSGIYFDERNVHAQQKSCNAGWRGNVFLDYTKFMLGKYGQKVIDDLEMKHHLGTDMHDLAMIGMKLFYVMKYQELLKENGFRIRSSCGGGHGLAASAVKKLSAKRKKNKIKVE